MILRRCVVSSVVLLFAAISSVGCTTSSPQTSDPDESRSEASPDRTRSEDDRHVDCDELRREADRTSGSSEASTDPPLQAVGPVATVGGDDIPASEFNTFTRKKMASKRNLSEPLANRLKLETAQQLVERRLIERRLAEASVQVERKELEGRYADFQQRFSSRERLREFLEQRQMSTTDLRAELCRDIQLKNYLASNYEATIDEEAVAEYYQQNRSEFETPARVEASHILVHLPEEASDQKVARARRRAEQLAERARDEETDFARLARRESDGPSAQKGGRLGSFTRERMVSEFAKQAFSMEPGEISDPVRTKFGLHVIKVHDRQPAQTQSLEEARPEIRRTLQRQHQRESLRTFLEEAEEEVSIEYHLENIEVNAEASATNSSEETESLPNPPGGAR